MPDSAQETPVSDHPKFNRQFVQKLAWVITFIWALSMVAQAVLPGYQPPASVGTAMTIVMAAAFGTNFFK